MGANDNNVDNSLESALSMSQEEIEKLLNGHQENMEESASYEAADLESLLSELEAMENDEDIQEISDLLDKADTNEAVDENIVDLMRKQEEVGDIPSYDAMDLFSASQEAQPVKKEGFIRRIIAKFKKNKKETEENPETIEESIEAPEKNEEQPTIKEKRAKKEKRPKKEKKKKDEKGQENQESPNQEGNVDIFQASEDALNGSDAIIFELEKEEIAKQEELDKIKPKKDKKSKKKADKKSKGEESEEAEGKGKKKKEKKPKEKKKKEKKVKIQTIDVSEFEAEEPVSKKKVRIIFFICIMLMLAIIAIIVNYSGHANRKLAEEAYLQEDYLECYQLLYGQHMDESQEVMFHKSELILKMELFWNRYNNCEKEQRLLEGLDKLIQFVCEYPTLKEYAANWNCEGVVTETYSGVLNTLSQEYQLDEQDALDIAAIESDIDYTKTLTELVEKKQQGKLKYPDMLPQEEERIEANQ